MIDPLFTLWALAGVEHDLSLLRSTEPAINP
jgi:hypothetical protein